MLLLYLLLGNIETVECMSLSGVFQWLISNHKSHSKNSPPLGCFHKRPMAGFSAKPKITKALLHKGHSDDDDDGTNSNNNNNNKKDEENILYIFSINCVHHF